jgi:hypothetical protein
MNADFFICVIRIHLRQRSAAQQYTHVVAFRIARNHVASAVTIDIGHGESPRASSNGHRRSRPESTTSIAEHDIYAISSRADDVVLGVAIHIGNDYMVKRASKIEWRALRFDKATVAVTDQHGHCILLVMSNHDVRFAIAVEIGDRRKPWLACAERKLARRKTAFGIRQQ